LNYFLPHHHLFDIEVFVCAVIKILVPIKATQELISKGRELKHKSRSETITNQSPNEY